MTDGGPGPDELFETVRQATRQGVREALWDVVTVVIAALLLLLGVPLAFGSAGAGISLASLAGVAVGLLIAAMGVYRLYDRFWRTR